MECLIVRPEDVDRESMSLVLIGDEAHHAVKSLRLRVGDELLATNLVGTCYKCRVENDDSTALSCSIEEILSEYGEPKRDVLLVQALIAQPARWEFLLEKATELGVRVIQPITTERTERADFKRERSERILRAAVKQTKRARMPELLEVMKWNEALKMAKESGRKILFLHEGAAVNASKFPVADRLAIVIGPEGGFSDDEVKRAVEEFVVTVVSLGPRRLRAETAALAALALAVK